MQDSVAETWEVTETVANAFQDFGFVVAALGIAVSKRNVKGVEDQLAPVVNHSGTVSEFRQMRGFSAVDPVSEQFFSRLGVWRVHKEQEVDFEERPHKILCNRLPSTV